MNFSGLRFPTIPLQCSSPLGGMAWAVLAGIPVGIIALYFLKLRRKSVRVSSTLLWRKSLEDLHVNSLFQRLRRNLLLFLQLLFVFLAMLALASPRVNGRIGQGKRYVIAIDNSASMSATDVSPSRLDRAKDQAKKVVESMESNDLAMIISFSDRARIVSNYTGDSRTLVQRINAISATEGTTSLRDALQVAAGLANPSKQIGEGVVATSVVTPKLYIYTDGGFPDVDGFSLGNLEPEVVVIGPASVTPPSAPTVPRTDVSEPAASKTPSDNVAILALQTRRNDEKPELYQVFGRIKNYRAEPVETEAKLLRLSSDQPSQPGKLIDAITLQIAAQSEQSFKFDLANDGLTELEVKIDVQDAQPLDNHAYTLIGNARKAQVLLVTSGNRYLADTLKTPMAVERADVEVITSEQAKEEKFVREMKTGRFDLVIFDRFRPESSPEANTLYFGAFPPGAAYDKVRAVERPVILDWDVTHPLMQFVRDLATVIINKAGIVDLPTGATSLIESNLGPIAFIAPREGFSDVVVTFPLLDGESFNTTWFKNISFPLFLFNSLQTLGNSRESLADEIHFPGEPVTLRLESIGSEVKVVGPNGSDLGPLAKSSHGNYVFNRADRTGIYHARWGEKGILPFVVNQFDTRESDIAPRGLVPDGVPPEKADAYKIKIGYNPVTGAKSLAPSRIDWWKPIAAVALGLLLFEWYIYNRRIYV